MIATLHLDVIDPLLRHHWYTRNVHLDVRIQEGDSMIVALGDLCATVRSVQYACDESNHMTVLVYLNDWDESKSAEEFEAVTAALLKTGWSGK